MREQILMDAEKSKLEQDDKQKKEKEREAKKV